MLLTVDELAQRRRDLEAEFDAKARDLKAQHKRQMDRLEQDRLEWEQYRRNQAKDLADKVEKARRRDANAVQKEEQKAATQEDVAALKARVQGLEEDKLKATARARDLEERLAKARAGWASARALLLAFGLGSLLATLAWLVVAAEDGRSLAWPTAAVAASGALNLWRWWLLRKAR